MARLVVVVVVAALIVIVAVAAATAMERPAFRRVPPETVVTPAMRKRARVAARLGMGYLALVALTGLLVGASTSVPAGLFAMLGVTVFGFATWIGVSGVVLVKYQRKQARGTAS